MPRARKNPAIVDMTDDQAKQAFWDAVEDPDPSSMEIAQDIALERGWKLYDLGVYTPETMEGFASKEDGATVHSRGSFAFGNWRTDDGVASVVWTVTDREPGTFGPFHVTMHYEFQHSDWQVPIVRYYENLHAAQHVAARTAWHDLGVMKQVISRGGNAYEKKLAFTKALDNVEDHDNVPGDLVSNPAWLNTAIADVYDVIQTKVPPEWLPKLDAHGKRGSLVATMKELGCGAYGCVIPTLDPGIVLKATTDTTETEFAAKLGQTLVVPVVVEYYMVVGLSATWHDRRISLLWRESAEKVGKISGKRNLELISSQHRAASRVLLAIKNGAKSMAVLESLFDQWVATLDKMASAPELAYVASGMKRVWLEQHIFLSDTHEGNLGQCKRGRDLEWVITDPGNVVVVET